MHSTVQTGLYTPNIFGYDYNYHNHPPPPNAMYHHHHPPAPPSFHASKSSSHHNLNYQLAKHPPLAMAPPPSHHHHHHNHASNHQQQSTAQKRGSSSQQGGGSGASTASVYASMLAINRVNNDESENNTGKQSKRLIVSASTPKFRMYSSSSNLDKIATTSKIAAALAAMTPLVKPNYKEKSPSLCSCQNNNNNSTNKICEHCRRRKSSTTANPNSNIKNSNSIICGDLKEQSKQQSNSLSCLLSNTIVPTIKLNDTNEQQQQYSPPISTSTSLAMQQQQSGANFSTKTGAEYSAMSKSSSFNGQPLLGNNNYSIYNNCSNGSYKNFNGVGGGAKMTSMQKFKEFWQCTKPCGVLTFALGITLVLASVAGFLFTFEASVCERVETCYNPLLSISTISALVIGIVVILVGLIIVIYTKKDENASVIVTSSKHMQSTLGSKSHSKQSQQKHQKTPGSQQKQQNPNSNTRNLASSSSSNNHSLATENNLN